MSNEIIKNVAYDNYDDFQHKALPSVKTTGEILKYGIKET
jgi:hypothetical protein